MNMKEMVGKDLCTNIHWEAEDSPGKVVVVMVVVDEAGGAVETERGGWEVGGTAEDGEEGEGAVKRQVIPIRAHPD